MPVSVAEARDKFSQLLREARDKPIEITARGKVVGVIIGPEEFERIQKIRAYLQIEALGKAIRERGLSGESLYRASREELEARGDR